MSSKKLLVHYKQKKTNIWRDLNLWGLLIYSLLPGFSKIFDNQIFFLGSLPILLYLMYPINIKLYKFDICWIVLTIYIISQSIFYIVFGGVNRLGLCMSIFMNVIPMLGYVYSREISLNRFFEYYIRIVSIHCIIAILIYPYFNFGISSHPYVEAMQVGDSMGRMTSVSGSLGFGNMIMIGLIIAVIKQKKFIPLILFCWIFSAQRSAWIGGLLGIFIYLYEIVKNGKIGKVIFYIVFFACIALLVFYIISSALEIDLSFIEYRIGRIGGAASERQIQWIHGWENFKSNFLGYGGGQVGQIATRHEGGLGDVYLVPDGDYFRILSEYGIMGISFFVATFILLFILLVFTKVVRLDSIIVLGIISGCYFQMIGSNITEFYFTNFVIWFFFGKFYLIVNKKLKNL